MRQKSYEEENNECHSAAAVVVFDGRRECSMFCVFVFQQRGLYGSIRIKNSVKQEDSQRHT